MKKFLFNTYCVLSVVAILYMAVCYIDITCKNIRPNPEYKSWNILVTAIRSIDAAE